VHKEIRVAKFEKCSPIFPTVVYFGQIFEYDRSSADVWVTFSTVPTSCVYVDKNGLGYILGDFYLLKSVSETARKALSCLFLVLGLLRTREPIQQSYPFRVDVSPSCIDYPFPPMYICRYVPTTWSHLDRTQEPNFSS
jgi:hypothetical protein